MHRGPPVNINLNRGLGGNWRKKKNFKTLIMLIRKTMNALFQQRKGKFSRSWKTLRKLIRSKSECTCQETKRDFFPEAVLWQSKFILMLHNTTLSEKEWYNDLDAPHSVGFWHFLQRVYTLAKKVETYKDRLVNCFS